eukprot:CAMPEP_0170560368 /NCGR_PEP_ID=MMETSP0211-20121228/48515_1 /TAXON_ID=311385 /ORGANISM="Pseudokeronopsis sp., Strain OXSARD2" /LENGTH=50 /DNA_ID=CAMNT_0010874463 /DNA_START=406 /DNA_END=555 /DNA_ORIENTATION=+
MMVDFDNVWLFYDEKRHYETLTEEILEGMGLEEETQLSESSSDYDDEVVD